MGGDDWRQPDVDKADGQTRLTRPMMVGDDRKMTGEDLMAEKLSE